MEKAKNMQRDVFIVAIVVLCVGIVLIPISQLTQTEIRDHLGPKQTIPILSGETSFIASLESSTRYQLFVKGGLVAPSDPIKINVLAPDNATFSIELPLEEPKSTFQTLDSSGAYNFTFESASAGANTRAEISEVVPFEAVTHPFASFLYVGIAFVIVGTAFALIGLKFPMKRVTAQ